MKVKLVVVTGKPHGREIPLPSTVFVIGRDPQCHLRPHSDLVSKLHCAIARKAGKLVVRDLQSSNGTFLNSQPIKGEAPVSDGDRLGVGDLVFAFRIEKTEEAQPIQIVDEHEVNWLMASPGDSSVLEADRTTKLVGVPSVTGTNGYHQTPAESTNGASSANGTHANGAAGEAAGSKTVSAGQYLRDYLKQRR
jgi:hypothetical protein